MANITKPLVLNETAIETNKALDGIRKALLYQAGSREGVANWDEVQEIVRNNRANTVFGYGDQLTEKYTVSESVSYDVPMNVVSFDDGELVDGETIHTMTLQWHYATPSDIQFSQYQAFYVSDQVIPAGTYNVTMGYNWEPNVVQGKTYQFTLTQPVPVGGILRGFERITDVVPENWTVKPFATQSALTPIETVPVTEGADGTNLGTFLTTENGDLNSLQRVAWGSNRYKDSAVRQWLNSDKPAGQWWTPQTKWDSAPTQLATLRGFLANFPTDFVSKMQPCKVVVMTNTVTEGGVEDVMYDKVFLPSLENIFATQQVAGEGPVWPYWQRTLGLTSRAQIYPVVYEAYKTYGINNKTVPVNARLRSAYRGNAYTTWLLYASGYVYYGSAIFAYRCAPACRIG